MKTNQEQILSALAGLIPEDAQKEVGAAVKSFLENATAELEKEYNTKLEEAFQQVNAEKTADERVAEEGYSQAWGIITDLRNRLEVQKEEFNQALEDGFEEAYGMLQEERAKNDTLEVDLYEEYDKRLADIKEYMIDKIDQFLQVQGEKYYEMAKRDVMNDPTFAEHRVAFDSILEVASKYISDEDRAFATTSKVDGLQRSLEDTKSQMRILEAKNMRLATENNKLNETVKQSQEMITEHVGKSDRKARIEKARKVEGRGQSATERHVVIGEQKDHAGAAVAGHKNQDDTLVEQIGENVERVVNDWKHLSGLIKEEAE